MADQNEPVHMDTTQARAGVTPHMTRYVLGFGLVLVIAGVVHEAEGLAASPVEIVAAQAAQPFEHLIGCGALLRERDFDLFAHGRRCYASTLPPPSHSRPGLGRAVGRVRG